MSEVDHPARFETQVGFNFIIEDARQALKNRLLNGEFGELKRAGFSGFWPRSAAYFKRASWAGRLRLNGHLVLDSCLGNAMAHYVHNLLFWCGRGELLSWGEVESVEAELVRAHAIESFDTAFARGVCGGVEIRVGATHAGSGASWQREWLECERAHIVFSHGQTEVRWNDGSTETSAYNALSTTDFLTRNLRAFAGYLNGEAARPLTTLADSRPFVHFNALLFVAAGAIGDVPARFVTRSLNARGDEFLSIQNIEPVLEEFAQSGALPSETGLAWSQPGGRAKASEVSRLLAPSPACWRRRVEQPTIT